jgi:hypothetical protein
LDDGYLSHGSPLSYTEIRGGLFHFLKNYFESHARYLPVWPASSESKVKSRVPHDRGSRSTRPCAAVGKSVGKTSRRGPDLRVYAGLKCEFDAPWKKRKESK